MESKNISLYSSHHHFGICITKQDKDDKTVQEVILLEKIERDDENKKLKDRLKNIRDDYELQNHKIAFNHTKTNDIFQHLKELSYIPEYCLKSSEYEQIQELGGAFLDKKIVFQEKYHEHRLKRVISEKYFNSRNLGAELGCISLLNQHERHAELNEFLELKSGYARTA